MLDKKGMSYHQEDFTEEDQTRLWDMLKDIKGKLILSYDNHPFIRKLYKVFRIERVKKVNYSMNRRPRPKLRYQPEVIIRNY
jgi:DNA adenine methylase